MRTLYFFLISILVFSCSNKKKKEYENIKENQQIRVPEFQKILNQSEAKGSILIYDYQKKTFYSNDFQWANIGKLPASTFKIPNSIIALEMRLVENDSTLFEWDGEPRDLDIWEQDLLFKDAFQLSCVPCYQEIARKIGAKKMNMYLRKFKYGDIQIDSTTIDRFWLEGSSRITQFQQIDFIARLFEKKLPIASKTDSIVKNIMINEVNDNYVLRGKTGWSVSNSINNGWFVGYLETKKGAYFFAANVEPKEKFIRDRFIKTRKKVVMKALKQLSILD